LRDIWKKIKRFFFLRPYGGNLLSPSANVWLIGVFLLISMMAIIEGLVWGSLTNYVFSQTLRAEILIPLSLFVGLFVFSVVWLIDMSFVTLDITESPTDENQTKKKSNWKRYIIPGLVRIILVCFSLVITMPELTKLTNSSDINEYITNENKRVRSELRDSLSTEFLHRIQQLDSMIVNSDNKLYEEISGVGPNGLSGDGPAANSLREIRKKQVESKSQVQAKHLSFLDDFDNLSQAQIELKYGALFKEISTSEINNASRHLSKNESYQSNERVSMAFLLSVFAAIILFKLFQPRSIRIYFNEQLQDLYNAYRDGHLADQFFSGLRREERESGRPVTPFRFEEFWRDVYHKRWIDFKKKLNEDQKSNILNEKLSSIDFQVNQLRKELPSSQALRDEQFNVYQEKDAKKNELESQIEDHKEAINDCNNEINQIENARKNAQLRPEDYAHLSVRESELKKKKEHSRSVLSKHKLKYEIVLKEVVKAESDYSILKEMTDAILSNLEELIDLKKRLRSDFARGFEELIDDLIS